jgi:hypothetical protein
MRAAAQRKSSSWSLEETFGFVFDGVMKDLNIDQCYDYSCSAPETGRLIFATDGSGMELDKLHGGLWKLRFREGCSPETLDALVDELLAESFKFLGIKVIKATRKSSTAPLRRAA